MSFGTLYRHVWVAGPSGSWSSLGVRALGPKGPADVFEADMATADDDEE